MKVLTGIELEDIGDERQQRIGMMAAKPSLEYPNPPEVVALGVHQVRGHVEQTSAIMRDSQVGNTRLHWPPFSIATHPVHHLGQQLMVMTLILEEQARDIAHVLVWRPSREGFVGAQSVDLTVSVRFQELKQLAF